MPYHALPKLHAAVKDDCAPPYPSLFAAWREIVPTILKQVKDPGYHVKRQLPEPSSVRRKASHSSQGKPDAEGWVEVCAAADLGRADVIRFDHGKKTFALYRTEDGELYATDGLCTHGNVHLSNGLVKGKHHRVLQAQWPLQPHRWLACARADLPRSGHLSHRGAQRPDPDQREPRRRRRRAPAKDVSVPRRQQSQRRHFYQGTGARTARCPADKISFTPGDYLQIDIPAYDAIRFRDFDIPEPFATVWEQQHVFDLVARNPEAGRRNNYSLASNQQTERTLASMCASRRRRRVRTALPASAPATFSASSPETSSPPLARSAIFISSRRSARWSTSAAAPAWLRFAPIFPILLETEKIRAQGQLLVRRPLKAGDFLRRLLPKSGR